MSYGKLGRVSKACFRQRAAIRLRHARKPLKTGQFLRSASCRKLQMPKTVPVTTRARACTPSLPGPMRTLRSIARDDIDPANVFRRSDGRRNSEVKPVAPTFGVGAKKDDHFNGCRLPRPELERGLLRQPGDDWRAPPCQNRAHRQP